MRDFLNMARRRSSSRNIDARHDMTTPSFINVVNVVSRFLAGGSSVSVLLLICFVWFVFSIQACAKDKPISNEEVHHTTKSSQSADSNSCYLREAGRLNYEYLPGLIVPLADGRILALDGRQRTKPERPERILTAEDGHSYGDGGGMVELFDPKSGQTKVLTRMPFIFSPTEAPMRSRIGAIQLRDGRLFLCGLLIENRNKNPDLNFLDQRPINSSTNPKRKLEGISPRTEPELFAVIFDWRNAKFERIKTTEFPARMMSTFHLLPDGRVLIFGGAVSTELKSSWKHYPDNRVLVFDPKTKRISVAGKLIHARYGHRSIAGPNGTFLLFGGIGPSDTEAREKYCLIRNPDGRCCAELPVIHTKQVERFDPASGKSTIVGRLLTRRDSFSLIELPNHKLLVHGGPVSSLLGHRASELYDSKANNSQFVGEELTPDDPENPDYPVFFHGEGIYSRAGRKDGCIVLAGQEEAFVYRLEDLPDSAALKRNQSHCNLLQRREYHHLIRTTDDRLFVIGGRTARKFSGNIITNPRAADLIEEFAAKSRGN
jgi:hypothetical protein